MNPKIAILTAATLLLSGCASTQWVKPGATMQEFQQDAYSCQRDAAMLPVAVYGGAFADIIQRVQLRDQCMGAKGWIKTTVK